MRPPIFLTEDGLLKSTASFLENLQAAADMALWLRNDI
jgi:hypothetical protein